MADYPRLCQAGFCSDIHQRRYSFCHLGIPQEIIDAKPTDGLWDDNRVDEDQIGATYEELEWAMEYGDNKSIYTEKEYNILEIYQNFNDKNKHKMVPIPIFDLKKQVSAVLDIDSVHLNGFDACDQEGIKNLASLLNARL
mgnify:CR=1 FL=1